MKKVFQLTVTIAILLSGPSQGASQLPFLPPADGPDIAGGGRPVMGPPGMGPEELVWRQKNDEILLGLYIRQALNGMLLDQKLIPFETANATITRLRPDFPFAALVGELFKLKKLLNKELKNGFCVKIAYAIHRKTPPALNRDFWENLTTIAVNLYTTAGSKPGVASAPTCTLTTASTTTDVVVQRSERLLVQQLQILLSEEVSPDDKTANRAEIEDLMSMHAATFSLDDVIGNLRVVSKTFEVGLETYWNDSIIKALNERGSHNIKKDVLLPILKELLTKLFPDPSTAPTGAAAAGAGESTTDAAAAGAGGSALVTQAPPISAPTTPVPGGTPMATPAPSTPPRPSMPALELIPLPTMGFAETTGGAASPEGTPNSAATGSTPQLPSS